MIVIPPHFTEKVVRGEKPAILISADATDPSAAHSNARSAQQHHAASTPSGLGRPVTTLTRQSAAV